MKKAMTLIELLIVVVIIGILATTMIVNYQGTSRAALRAKARHALSIIGQAEKIVRSDTGAWATLANLPGATGIDFTPINNDVHFTYAIAGTVATATRRGTAQTVTYNFGTNVWGGTF
ncbi:MAG: type II secretion system protein [Candidatus Omnitrophota bacterium]|nr:type II secretion system GspH family protein [Candidatus Omnitrophota bacterium]